MALRLLLVTTVTYLRVEKSWNSLTRISFVAPFMILASPAMPRGMSGGKIDDYPLV